jgi:hypothetical protein
VGAIFGGVILEITGANIQNRNLGSVMANTIKAELPTQVFSDGLRKNQNLLVLRTGFPQIGPKDFHFISINPFSRRYR